MLTQLQRPHSKHVYCLFTLCERDSHSMDSFGDAQCMIVLNLPHLLFMNMLFPIANLVQ